MNSSAGGRFWRLLRWPLFILVALGAAYLAWGFYLLHQKTITEQGVAQINSHKLTLADVEGKNLPQAPNQIENDATVAGIDKNNNGIRDDVELAIFKKYPNDLKVRAAELQYAMALQTDITEAFNGGTWVAAEYQDWRASQCLADTFPRTNLKQFTEVIDGREKEIKGLILNTSARQRANQEYLQLEGNMPFNPPDSDFCDVVI